MLANIDNQISIASDQVTPSKSMTPTTKIKSYKDKKYDSLAIYHLKPELLREMKHSVRPYNNMYNYMDEYIKAMEAVFLREEVKEKKAFMKQVNNNNKSNDNSNTKNNNKTVIGIILVIMMIMITAKIMTILLITIAAKMKIEILELPVTVMIPRIMTMEVLTLIIMMMI